MLKYRKFFDYQGNAGFNWRVRHGKEHNLHICTKITTEMLANNYSLELKQDFFTFNFNHYLPKKKTCTIEKNQ